MRRYKISNEFTLPRAYNYGEVDSFKILANEKLYDNELISSINVIITDENDEDRTAELLIRKELIVNVFNYIGILFKAGIDEDDSLLEFKIEIEILTSLDRKIKIDIYFNVK